MIKRLVLAQHVEHNGVNIIANVHGVDQKPQQFSKMHGFLTYDLPIICFIKIVAPQGKFLASRV